MFPQYGTFQAVQLSAGSTYDAYFLGDGVTAATLNRFYCISAGTMTMTLIGGGTFTTAPMTPGQEFYALPNSVKVNAGGVFIGFRPKHAWGTIRLTP
jgi:hypothetical protein